jgi:hypothetical protein
MKSFYHSDKLASALRRHTATVPKIILSHFVLTVKSDVGFPRRN